jgi:hypothetical protein
MKVMASRKPLPGQVGDFDDIEKLLRITKIKSVDEVQTAVDAFFPDTVLPQNVQLQLSDLLDKIHARNTPLPPEPAPHRTRSRTAS